MSGNRPQIQQGPFIVCQWVCRICNFSTIDINLFTDHCNNHRLATTVTSNGQNPLLQPHPLLRDLIQNANLLMPAAASGSDQLRMERGSPQGSHSREQATFSSQMIQDATVLTGNRNNEPANVYTRPLLYQLERPLPEVVDLGDDDNNRDDLDVNLHL